MTNRHPDDIPLIEQAEKLLIANISYSSNLKLISLKVGLNRDKLSKLFKESYGKTMHQYFLDKRFEAAKILLAKGFLVQEVAQRVGYSDIATFSKSFKKRFGLTPLEFKARGYKMTN